ncbi:hypothetical protein ABBQ38_000562 [Trebouxia sp. C0009 RCD-2024]
MECGTEMASAGSWQEAVSRSAEAAAHAVAAAAAFSFRQKLLELASVQAGRQGSLGNSPRAVQTHNDPSTKPGHCLNSPHADAGRAVGRAPAEGATSGCCEVEDVQLGPKEVAGLGDKAVNENELQLGLELHAEVQRRIRLCGQRLLTDRRIKCAQAPERASAMEPPSPGATPNSSTPLTTLAAVAQHAQQGQFHSMQAFVRAVRKAVVGTCLAVKGRLARQDRQGRPASTGYSVRAAAACALGDDIALWCHAITHQLLLTQPASQRLLAVAHRHFASQHQQQQQQQHGASQQQQQQHGASQQPQHQQQQPQQQQQQGAPAAATRHIRTDTGTSSGLMASSDDSGSLDAQPRTARTLSDARNEHEVAIDGTKGDGGADARGVVELQQDVQGSPVLQLDGPERDTSRQVLPSLQAAGCDEHEQLQVRQHSGSSDQPGVSQQAGASHEPGVSQPDKGSRQPSSDQQQWPAGAYVRSRAEVQRSCVKMQSTLQAALLPMLLESVRKCKHDLPALLQQHDALIAAALERLPAISDNLQSVLQSTAATEAADTCLLHCQALLVKDMQAFCEHQPDTADSVPAIRLVESLEVSQSVL